MSHATLLPTATRCRSCGRRTRWVYSPAGARACIDAEPHPQGVLVLVDDDGRWVAERRRPYRAEELRAEGHELYRHHTCGL